MFDGAQKRTLITVCLGMFMAFLDGTVVNLALPVIQRDLNTGISALQWIVDGYVLCYAAFMLSGGSLADRYGRKRLFLTGLAVFVIGSVVCAVSPDAAVLVGGRILQGIGGALFVPGTLAILANAFPDPRQRAAAIGIWSSVSGISLAIGPIAGGVLVAAYGWQSVFWINVPIGVVVLGLAARWLAESSAPEGRRLDLPGQALAVGTLAAVTYALIEGGNLGWGSPLIVGLFAAAVVGAALFILVEGRATHPMLPLTLFRSVNFATSVGIALLVGFGLLGSFFFLSLFLQNIQGFTPLAAGLRLLPAVLAVSVCAPMAGRLAGRFGSRYLMGTGMAIVGVTLLLFHQVGPDTSYARWWPILLGIGAGVGLTMTPMIAALMSSVHPMHAALASAAGNTGQQVGGMLGIAGLGTVIANVFPAVFRARTMSLGLPEALRERIATGGTTGTIPRGLAVPAGVDPDVVRYWARFAFVEGMHRALLIAGGIYLVGAVIAVIFIRRPASPAPPGAAPGRESGQAVRPGPSENAPGTAGPAASEAVVVDAAARRRTRALMFELPVGALLLASWFTVLLVTVHAAVGLMFGAVAVVHLATRPGRVAALARAAGRVARARWRLSAVIVLAVLAAGVTVTGLLQWEYPVSGPARAAHIATSFLVIVLAARHVWLRRRPLAASLRSRPAR